MEIDLAGYKSLRTSTSTRRSRASFASPYEQQAHSQTPELEQLMQPFDEERQVFRQFLRPVRAKRREGRP